MANKIKLARGLKSKIETVKANLEDYEIVYSYDTKEIGVKTGAELVWYPNVTNLSNKVDKVSGKGLSTNDYTTTEKNKLSGIETGAQKNVGVEFTQVEKNKLNGIAAGAQVNVGTNLSQGARSTTTLRIDSSTGTNLTLPAVTTDLAGLMTAAYKNKLDGIAHGAQVNRAIATTTQAQTGTDNTTVMTPLRVKEAISASGGGTYTLTKTEIDTALAGWGTSSIQLGQSASAAGDYSTALGGDASASAQYSTALGYNTTVSGTASTALGRNASASAQHSTALGYNTTASGSYSTALGRNASASGAASTAIGSNADTGTSNNTIQLGSSSALSTLRSRVQLTVTSDIRDKADIEEVPKALDFIKDLNPITYVSNERDHYISEEQKETDTYKDYLMVEDYDKQSHSQGTKKGGRRRVGLSAQEVREKLIEHYGSDNYANVVNDNFVEFEERELDIPEGLENKLTMSYETMVPFLIKAIQEQQEQIEELKKQINKE